jgi:LytR cell envelope-related transcriptional attenuator
VNLGTARIIIIVALVVVGVTVLSNAFRPGTATIATLGSTPAASPSDGHSGTPTESHSPKPLPSPDTTGVLVSVFNGIDAPNCAGTVSTMLLANGYRNADPPADATSKPVGKTTVYFRPDPKRINHADALYVATTYFNKARVAKLPQTFPGVVSDTTQVAILIGNDYRSNCG